MGCILGDTALRPIPFTIVLKWVMAMGEAWVSGSGVVVEGAAIDPGAPWAHPFLCGTG